MVILKTQQQIDIMREGGKILARILDELSKEVVPGIRLSHINDRANELCKQYDVIPVLLNYHPEWAKKAYPASICVSLNNEIIHGIPNKDERVFQDGDIVSLDTAISYQGLIIDSAITIPCGTIDQRAKDLIRSCKEALQAGIDAAKIGVRTGDIGYAYEKVVKSRGFSLPEELCGHGVGVTIHEDPAIPNYGVRGEGVVLKPGMTITIEPMITEGTKKISIDRDGYTCKTADGKRSAHAEHTIAITETGPIILTKL